MTATSSIHILFLFLAIGLEVTANVLLKYSNGFRRRWLGVASIAFVLASFTALAQAVRGIDLSLAYAVWGGFGVIATFAIGWVLFNQKLTAREWFGLALLLTGMIVLKLA